LGALHTGGLRPADAPEKTVLVTAASSGVGTMALRIARAWGAHTRATTRSHAKAVALHPLADRVFVAESADELLAAAPDLAADVLIDPVGADYLPALIACARRDGQIVIYERISGTFATLDLKAVIGRELGVHGFTIYRFIRNAPLLRTLIEEMMHLADGGHVTPVVHQAFAFEHAPDALRALEQGEHVGKLVVTIGP
jgi:NADPH:quinone reductase-like Zn-dependent oxidoreductase